MQDRYFDIGVNLTHESFDNDYKNVIENAFKNSVDRICLTGTSIEDSEKCIEITKEFQGNLISTVGIHPHYADNFNKSSKITYNSGDKKQFSNKNIIAVYELHTFSSFSKDFINEYQGTMSNADIKIIYYDKDVLRKKSEIEIDENTIKIAFGDYDLKVFSIKSILVKNILDYSFNNSVLLLMSSGNFSSLNINSLIENINSQ